MSYEGLHVARSARSLFWLHLSLGALGVAAAALAAGAAARAFDPALPTTEDLRSVCAGMLVTDSLAGRVVFLLLAVVAITVPLRGMRSALRQTRATRQLVRALPVVDRRDGSPALVVVRDARPLAFCCGYLRPRVYVSTGALDVLGTPELSALLSHEYHHARRRDPLRMLLVEAVRDAVFFVPVLRRCEERFGTLSELAADEHAITTTGAGPLAGALAAFDTHGGQSTRVDGERVDHLLGMRRGWQIERAAVLRGVWTAAGLAAVAVAAAASLRPQSVGLAGVASTACALLIVASALVFVRALPAAGVSPSRSS